MRLYIPIDTSIGGLGIELWEVGQNEVAYGVGVGGGGGVECRCIALSSLEFSSQNYEAP